MVLRTAYLALCAAAAANFALAEDAHQHPADAKSESQACGHEHMQRMHAQMQKIRSATDPKEKQQLVEEHMKSMEEHMSMMDGMMKSHGRREHK